MQRYWSSLRYSFLRTLFLLAADLRRHPTPDLGLAESKIDYANLRESQPTARDISEGSMHSSMRSGPPLYCLIRVKAKSRRGPFHSKTANNRFVSLIVLCWPNLFSLVAPSIITAIGQRPSTLPVELFDSDTRACSYTHVRRGVMGPCAYTHVCIYTLHIVVRVMPVPMRIITVQEEGCTLSHTLIPI